MLLFGIGLALLLIEFFAIPGFGVTGIGGLALILLSVFLAFDSFSAGLAAVAIGLLGTVVLVLVGFRKLPRSKVWSKLALDTSLSTDAGYLPRESRSDLVGQTGTTITVLRPAGTALINDERVDVVSEGGWVEANTPIIVTQVEGLRIVVKEQHSTKPTE